MGIRRKGTTNTLPTYECRSIGYYSLFWGYCQVRIPFRVSSDEGIQDLTFLFAFISDHRQLRSDIRANNKIRITTLYLLLQNRIQATRPKIQRLLNNSYAITLSQPSEPIRFSSDCYLSVPGKDLLLFNTQIKVSEKLNCDCREDRLCAKLINRCIA